jgi:sulfonate transport system substrate-binding protein
MLRGYPGAVSLKPADLTISPIPGAAQTKVLNIIGPIFVESGDVPAQSDIDSALSSLLEPKSAMAAVPTAIK